MALYEYTSTNSELVSGLGLTRHIEGGYFKETHRCEDLVASPLADGHPRPISTTIYYLLTADEPRGYFHRNKSHTMHVLHQGRSRYCLISPRPSNPAPGSWKPAVTYSVMGADSLKGEDRQLFVAGDVWKMSGIPEEDLAASGVDKEKVGCLITEVVTPGFVWEDHEWMTMGDLQDIFEEVPGGDAEVAKFARFIRPTDPE